MERSLISITDSTLSDWQGRHPTQVGTEDPVNVAVALQATGIDALELRIDATNPGGIAAARAVCQALVTTASIGVCPRERDIDAAARAGLARVMVPVPLSNRQIREEVIGGRPGLLARISRLIAHGRSRGLDVGVSGEDASRADPDFVLRALAAAQQAGAVRFRFVDTFGVLEPLGVHAIFRRLHAESDLELEFRGGDDLGLAAQNAVTAVRAGARRVNTSLFVLGADANAARLTELVTGLLDLDRFDVRVKLGRVPAAVKLIADASGKARQSRLRRGATVAMRSA
jgi:homocitrate synthase NifV